VWNWSNPQHEALQGEIMSRSESEPGSASLEINERVASLPNRMKPDIGVEEADIGRHRTLRGVRGQRVMKEGPGTWETRGFFLRESDSP
jgi:hypothetical protein